MARICRRLNLSSWLLPMPMTRITKRPANTIRAQHELSAEGVPLGRLATKIATLLQGKNKASYFPGVDSGDFVVIRDAAKVAFSGRKLNQKVSYQWSGYPGGAKERKLSTRLQRDPSRLIRETVWNMLPKNKLRKPMLRRLTITR